MHGSDAQIAEEAVTYAAVGATRSDDLLRHPPSGFRAFERRVRIGHGPERWEHAWVETLSLGIQRRAGIGIHRIDAPAEARVNSYAPVGFDAGGRPVRPADTTSDEAVFSASGAELVQAGDTAILRPGWTVLGLRAPVRIVYVVDEPDRRGFAYGTLPGHPESGEAAFVVDRGPDGSVWLTIRGFSRPAHLGWWLMTPVRRIVQAIFTARYERSLAQPLD